MSACGAHLGSLICGLLKLNVKCPLDKCICPQLEVLFQKAVEPLEKEDGGGESGAETLQVIVRLCF